MSDGLNREGFTDPQAVRVDAWQAIADVASALLEGGQTDTAARRNALRALIRNGIDVATSAALLEPQPAPELAAAMRETRLLRERVAALAARLDADADGTSPSRKSEIQRDAARRLREALGGTS